MLRASGASATIDVERGGRLSSLVVAGRELLVGPSGPDDRSIRWGCFLMAPWVGRIDGARLTWLGKPYQLSRTHGRHAIHGVVFDRPWMVEATSATEASLSCRFDPGSWPLGGEVRQDVGIDAGGLTLSAEISAGRSSMPAALGWHPWFRRGDTEPTLRVEANQVLRTRGMIPTGELEPVRGKTDLRAGPRLGSRRLDHAYVRVIGPAVIGWPDLRLRVEFEPPLSVVTVFTPPDAFCVEPQTAWPNALGLSGSESRAAGAVTLEAGESLSASMRIAWETPSGR